MSSKQNKQITYIFDISENISETIWNFWHNVHRRREHRFVVKLTACNPDFRRTKPSFTKVRGIISILMWTWKFSPPCYCVKIVDCQSGHLKINFPTEKILLCLISSIESWLILSEFRLESNTLRSVRFDEINLTTHYYKKFPQTRISKTFFKDCRNKNWKYIFFVYFDLTEVNNKIQ